MGILDRLRESQRNNASSSSNPQPIGEFKGRPVYRAPMGTQTTVLPNNNERNSAFMGAVFARDVMETVRDVTSAKANLFRGKWDDAIIDAGSAANSATSALHDHKAARDYSKAGSNQRQNEKK